jgi:hypothetical protein
MKEIWKDIKEYKGLYQVSNLGNVKSLSRKLKTKNGFRQVKTKILKPAISLHGYSRVILWKNNVPRNFAVHRLVAMNFLKKDSHRLTVNHKDGIKTNNNLNNLEWLTICENIAHSIKLGLSDCKGEKSPSHILKENQVLEIRELWQSSQHRLTDLMKIFNCSKSCISQIVHNRTWKHLTPKETNDRQLRNIPNRNTGKGIYL